MKKIVAVATLVFSTVFISCDKEFNTIGADLVGDEHFDFDKEEISGTDLKAYSLPTGEVQTNNLPVNPIGFYKNPHFGDTKANFVSQISFAGSQPKFGTSVQIENVTLYIPFFSHVESTDSDGASTYKLDSIYGADPESKMKLSVFENGYYLSSFDAVDQTISSKYYSDMDGLIDGQKRGADVSGNSVPVTSGGTRLNNSTDLSQNDEFFFNKEEIIIYKTQFNTTTGLIEYLDANDVVTTNPADYVVKERLAPGIYLDLNKDFFKKKILDAPSANLFNNNAFKQYFKGLYFQVEQIAGNDGAMAMLNFSNSRLKMNYNSISEGTTEATSKTLLLSLGISKGCNTVSLQNFSYGGTYATDLAVPENDINSATFGQNSRLHLKGGKGSVVYIEINQAKIDEFKTKKWLINDAYLEFYIDKDIMGATNQKEAERIYLFDATNQKTLVDYIYDSSTTTSAKRNKYVYGGIIQRDENKKGEKYKIRITQHINNILNSTDTTVNKNVKLGLCITDDISLISSYYFKNPLLFGPGADDDIKYFPAASILSQQGTVLHGTHSTDADKKLKLVIHYTKPN